MGTVSTLACDYLESFSTCKQQQDEKLDELFAVARDFVSAYSNWKAITKLANYILKSNKTLICCEEVISVLES
jgi:hypothetical protein